MIVKDVITSMQTLASKGGFLLCISIHTSITHTKNDEVKGILGPSVLKFTEGDYLDEIYHVLDEAPVLDMHYYEDDEDMSAFVYITIK